MLMLPGGQIGRTLQMSARGGGIPTADHVFDARNIKNPQKGPQKHLTGSAVDPSPRKICGMELTECDHWLSRYSQWTFSGRHSISGFTVLESDDSQKVRAQCPK